MAVDADADLRRAVLTVALLNLAYFAIEFAVALAIGSVSLFADSVDFLEDTSLNLLILVGLGWTARRRAKLGMVLAGILERQAEEIRGRELLGFRHDERPCHAVGGHVHLRLAGPDRLEVQQPRPPL